MAAIFHIWGDLCFTLISNYSAVIHPKVYVLAINALSLAVGLVGKTS